MLILATKKTNNPRENNSDRRHDYARSFRNPQNTFGCIAIPILVRKLMIKSNCNF